MTKPVTPEMVAAWRTLQNFALTTKGTHRRPLPWESELAQAIDVLDNSDFMVPIQDAELDTENDRLKAAGYLVIKGDEPLDPAEWGDTTREDIARHQATGDAMLLGLLDQARTVRGPGK